MSTHDRIFIMNCENDNSFTEENILNEFDKIAQASNFNFKFKIDTPIRIKKYKDRIIKEMVVKIENFKGISFMMSMPSSSLEDQEQFKAWSKFWASLTKIGYNVK